MLMTSVFVSAANAPAMPNGDNVAAPGFFWWYCLPPVLLSLLMLWLQLHLFLLILLVPLQAVHVGHAQKEDPVRPSHIGLVCSCCHCVNQPSWHCCLAHQYRLPSAEVSAIRTAIATDPTNLGFLWYAYPFSKPKMLANKCNFKPLRIRFD